MNHLHFTFFSHVRKWIALCVLLFITATTLHACRTNKDEKRDRPTWKDADRDDYYRRRRERYNDRYEEERRRDRNNTALRDRERDRDRARDRDDDDDDDDDRSSYSYEEEHFVVATRDAEVLWYSECASEYRATIGAKIDDWVRSLHRFSASSELSFVSCSASSWVDSRSDISTYNRRIGDTNSLENIILSTSSGGDLEDFLSENAFKAIILTANANRPERRRSFILHLQREFSDLDNIRVYALFHPTLTAASDIHPDYNTILEEFDGLFLSLTETSITSRGDLCCSDQSSTWHTELLDDIRHHTLKNTFEVEHDVHSVTSAVISGRTISARDISFKDNIITIDRDALTAGARIKLVYRTRNRN